MSAAVSNSTVTDFGHGFTYANGGASKLSSSVDPSQYSAAIHMIKVATENMHSQFARHLTVFEDIA